ncbi:MAG: PEGA domain-containing protein, partial [Acidobacteria bacterium]|nr:PEGA domain-containing protein [Acidobacteriota bacterium]
GTLQTKVNPKDWDNNLTVTSETVTLKLKDGQQLEVPTNSVKGISYGQEAHRRVGTMVALGILVAPLALFGLFHKTRLHFIGVEYSTTDGKSAGILLQGHKENYRAILMALRGATGAKVAVSEEERKFVPTGIQPTVGSSEANSAKPGAAEGIIRVSSVPDGAEVFVDGAFVGNAPATLKLPKGPHQVRMVTSGFRVWVREVTVLAGGESSVNATLEKE